MDGLSGMGCGGSLPIAPIPRADKFFVYFRDMSFEGIVDSKQYGKINKKFG